MTVKTREALKSAFETGDVPDGSDYADILDSFLNLTNTTSQSIASGITIGGIPTVTHVTANVSASASANTMLKFIYNGKEYGVKAYLIST